MSFIDGRWLEILKASGWKTSALAVASLVFFCLVRSKVIPVTDSPFWLVIPILVALVSAALAVADFFAGITKIFNLKERFAQWLQQRSDLKKLRANIPFLNECERTIFGYLLHHKEKTFFAEFDGGYAVGLISKGFIRREVKPGQSYNAHHVPFSIPNHIWIELERNKEAFPYTPSEEGIEKYPWAIPWTLK